MKDAGARSIPTGVERGLGEVITNQVEVWKSIIDVQKHFNDIELRVRSLALTVLTATLGATGFALKDGVSVQIGRLSIPLASVLLIAGAVVWAAFYMMDQVWYHRLLIGAVKQAEWIEEALGDSVPGIGLTLKVSAESKYRFRFLGRNCEWRSTDKIKAFYYPIFFGLLGFGLVLLIC